MSPKVCGVASLGTAPIPLSFPRSRRAPRRPRVPGLTKQSSAGLWLIAASERRPSERPGRGAIIRPLDGRSPSACACATAPVVRKA